VLVCAECGYVYEELPVPEITGTLRSFGYRYREVLDGVDAGAVSKRPQPAVWSALEYTCHVRDVLLVQRERVVLAQIEERPSFVRMYRDERVPLCGYSTSSMEPVLDQLRMAAELCAGVIYVVPWMENAARRHFAGQESRWDHHARNCS
jgi:DNA segregation ATPase FtsK/SpoIIIE, S-DNA-T family